MVLEMNGRNKLDTEKLNEEVLGIVPERSDLLKAIENLRRKIFEHLIQHYRLLGNIVEEKMKDANGRL